MPLRRSLRGKIRRKHGRTGTLLAIAAVPVAVGLVVVGSIVAALAVGTAVVFAAAAALFDDLPSVEGVSGVQSQFFESSTVYARDGTVLGELIGEGRRTVVSPDRIPQLIKDATIAAEDATFYENPGVDLRAVARAVWLNLQGGSIISGFSTITQQVVKNTLLSPEVSVERKLREVALAYQLSQRFSKDEILGIYLNQSYYGQRAYGIAAAASTYFDKDLDELTLAEAAMLVGIPRAPSTQDPLINEVAATRNQHNVLNLMIKNRLITSRQGEDAKAESIQYRTPEIQIGPGPHFFNYVVDYLQERYGSEISRKGWSITTTFDPSVQAQAEAAAREHVRTLAERGVGNAAVVVLEPGTGQILAMVGSLDFTDEGIDGQVNMAIAPRQPGSAFKPFTYLTALAKGYSPATMLLDIKTVIPIPDQEPYEPTNYDEKFRGAVRLRVALGSSLNIPAVRTQLFAGVTDTLDTARRMGLTISGGVERFGPSLVLGSAEVPLLDLAAAYGVLANEGLYVQPNPILRIEDSQGKVIEESKRPEGARIISRQLAYVMTDILSDTEARIPGFGSIRNLTLEDRPAAVKTGTTNDFRDALTVGYTPDFVTAVWAGNADNSEMDGVSGARGAAPIWNSVMASIHKGLPVRNFVRPEGLTTLEVDAVSGLLPNPYSPKTVKEIFIPGTEPTQMDQIHQPIRIHKLTGKRAGPSIPADEVELKVFPVLPREAEAWQREQDEDSPFQLPSEEIATVLDSPRALPDVAIAIPSNKQQVRSILEILGNARGPGFIDYTVEFGVGISPVDWIRIGAASAEQRSRQQLAAVDTIQLQDGVHALRLTVRREGNLVERAYRQFVVDNSPPEVAITGVAPGATLPRGQIAFAVDATDNGEIRSVIYFVDGEFVAESRTPPYGMTWSSIPGSHTLTVLVQDVAGNFAEAEPVPFRVP